MDSQLTWKPHMHEISKKINRSIGVLRQLRYYVNLNVLIQLYYSLIYPYLTYGIHIWGNTYQSTIQPLPKKALRIISF